MPSAPPFGQTYPFARHETQFGDKFAILAGVLTMHAAVGRPPRGDHEYVLWQIGQG